MRVTSSLCLFFATVLFAGLSLTADAKHVESNEEQNGAVIIGQAGEQYPIYGQNGIRVTGGHHGIWSSNMKSSVIVIDGSGITAQKYMPVNVNMNFNAAANGAYFVANDAVCTLATAIGAAGQEIVVCNAGKNVTITYQTVQGETLFSGSQSEQSGPAVNSTMGKVDRFISDGRSWFRE